MEPNHPSHNPRMPRRKPVKLESETYTTTNADPFGIERQDALCLRLSSGEKYLLLSYSPNGRIAAPLLITARRDKAD